MLQLFSINVICILGGSAMIPLESFVTLYTFLAKIDASSGQILRNYYFRDSLLSLWRERVEQEVVKEVVQEEVTTETDERYVVYLIVFVVFYLYYRNHYF